MELTLKKRMILIFGLEARIRELKLRVEHFETGIELGENVEAYQEALSDTVAELVETIVLKEELEG